jgi:hypothetical protein
VEQGHHVEQCPNYKFLSESSRTISVVTASVKGDRGGEGHTSINLLHQSATQHRVVKTHCFYTSAFSTSCFLLSVMYCKIEQCVYIKFCVKLSKSTT